MAGASVTVMRAVQRLGTVQADMLAGVRDPVEGSAVPAITHALLLGAKFAGSPVTTMRTTYACLTQRSEVCHLAGCQLPFALRVQ
jgi:hypothetical protein